jgi:hypothetical protein
MKHCDLLRQTCPEPHTCGDGCQVIKDMRAWPAKPDKPRHWAKDLVCTAVCAVGIVATLFLAGLAVVYLYVRFV